MPTYGSFNPVMQRVVNLQAQVSAADFIGTSVLPLAGMPVQSGTFQKIDVDALKEIKDDPVRAPASPYPRRGYKTVEDTFVTYDRGFEVPLDDSVAAWYSMYYNKATADAQNAVVDFLKSRERRIATQVFNDANYPASNKGTVATAWTDPVNATPFDDIKDAISAMVTAIGGIYGRAQIKLALGQKAFDNLIKTDDIAQRVRGGAGSTVNKPNIMPDELASILGINQVLVGKLTDGVNDVWDTSKALVFIDSPGADPASGPSFGRVMFWRQRTNSEFVVERYREESITSTVLRVRNFHGEKILSYKLGYLLLGLA